MVTGATLLLHNFNSKKANMFTLSPLGESVGEALSIPQRNPTQGWEMPQTHV